MLLLVGEAIIVSQRGRADPSGAPAISAYIAARLGVDTVFVGGVGQDDFGATFRRRLADAGMSTDTVQVVEGLPTARATVEYFPDGSRSFEFDVAGTAATEVRPDRLGELPERARWLHVSGSALLFGEPLAGTVVSAVHRARAAGATISLDPNLRPEVMSPQATARLRELCGLADYVFPSEGELAALDLAEQSLLDRGATICTTFGPRGCAVATATGRTSLPALRAAEDVVDTDGAGDTFAAGFIAATLAGADPVAAAGVASRVVAKAIAVPGPMTVELSAAELS